MLPPLAETAFPDDLPVATGRWPAVMPMRGRADTLADEQQYAQALSEFELAQQIVSSRSAKRDALPAWTTL